MYDYIVVGAGSAGCVLAHRLSSDPNVRVLVLEAGRDERRKEVTIPAAWPKLFRSSCDWAYQTEPNPGLDGRRLYVPRGRMLGGTSSLNAMVYVRGHRDDFDQWAAQGNDGWGYDEILPYFRRSEDNSRGASAYHGSGGPLSVCDAQEPNPISRAFVEAAVEAGIARNDDCNGPTQEGVGLLQATIRNGRRWSTADAFLRPVRRRPNLTVITEALTTRVDFEGQRAVGVTYRAHGREATARAEREVVLSAGAINTPRLLMLSGIGAADALRQHGIDVIHDLPGVGANLQEHPAGKLLVRCPVPCTLFAAESPGSVLRYLVFRRGMLASNGPESAAFVRTRSDRTEPDAEIICLPVLWLNEGFTAPAEHGFTIAVVVLKPRSRGFVALRSRDPAGEPAIHTNHFSDAEGDDMRTAVDGMRMARHVLATKAFAPFNGGEILPGPDATSDAALAASVRADGQTIWHPVGTCRMGTDGMSVVDATLRVRGVDRLRVVDASVMPTITGGHVNAAVIMIAEKAADLLVGRTAPSVSSQKTTLSS